MFLFIVYSAILLMSLSLGFFESMAFTLQNFNIPSQITSMLLYIITLAILFLYSLIKQKKIKLRKQKKNWF